MIIKKKYQKKNKKQIPSRHKFARKKYYLNTKFIKLIKKKTLKKHTQYAITLKLTPNNIFGTLKNIKEQKTLIVFSAGMRKINVSKRKLKFFSKFLIPKFIKKIQKKTQRKTCIITLSSPRRLRKKIFRIFADKFKKRKLILRFDEKKPFNGCRVKKQKHKKRKGLRFFK